MNTTETQLVGACGLYCGACGRYRAVFKEGQYLLEDSGFKGQEREEVICYGCHSGRLSGHCNICAVRLCAKEKELVHCGLCAGYPCDKIEEMYGRAGQHERTKHCGCIKDNLKRIQQIGYPKWLIEQEKMWTCECGFHAAFYDEVCANCGKKRLNRPW